MPDLTPSTFALEVVIAYFLVVFIVFAIFPNSTIDEIGKGS
jgi:hypothetical protein